MAKYKVAFKLHLRPTYLNVALVLRLERNTRVKFGNRFIWAMDIFPQIMLF